MSEFVVPLNEFGERMSPYEKHTGVVLPIVAPPGNSNRHHGHFYKKQFEHGSRPARGYLRAVRFSRLQLVNNSSHQAYHDHFHGTAMPIDARAAFKTVSLNESGYIPGWVVDMGENGRRPEIVETTPEMRERLRVPGVLSLERSRRRRREIGQFLMYFSIRQRLAEDVRESDLDEFVSLTPELVDAFPRRAERWDKLGMKLVNIAIGHAVDPVERTFHQARDAQALRLDAANCAFWEVKTYVNGHEPDYFNALQNNLRLQIAA